MHLRCHFAVAFPFISRAFALFVLMLASGGCLMWPHSASKTDSPATVKSQPEVVPVTTRPDGMDASTVNPAELLTQRAQSYSQEMAPAIARRTAAPPTPVSPTAVSPTIPAAPPQPSLVQWGDPSATHLSLLPGYLLRPDGAPPAPAPVETSGSSANPHAPQLASMRSDAIPNSGAVVSAEPPTRDAAPPDRAQAQIASMAPAAGAPQVTNDGSSDGQANSQGVASGETLSAIDARLATRVRDYPHDVSAHFDYQLLQFLMDQPVPNLSTISSLPDEDREMLSAVMDGLSMYRNNLRADNNMLLSKKVTPLLEMADRLRSLADLTIPTLALCREVRGYGNYEPFDGDPPHFSAGAEHPVILYCEVQNFSSQLDDSKLWQTQLVQDAVLYTEGGMSVWTDKTQAVNDSARNRRQDFFIVQRMKLPATLPVGRYLLKVTIEDKQSHHVAEATQPLMIVAE